MQHEQSTLPEGVLSKLTYWLSVQFEVPRWLSLAVFALVFGGVIGVLALMTSRADNGLMLFFGVLLAPAFVLVVVARPEIGILTLIGLTSGVIDTDFLPVIPLGSIDVRVPEIVLVLLLGLSFLRVLTRPLPKALHSHLMIPLTIFLIALAYSVYTAVVGHSVPISQVFPVTRQMFFWLAFYPIVILIDNERTLRRFLNGLWFVTALLAFGVLAPNLFTPLHLLPQRDVILNTAGRQFSAVSRIFTPSERILYTMIPAAIGMLAMKATKRPFIFMVILLLMLNWLFQSFQRNYWLTTVINLGLLFFFITSSERFRLIRRLLPSVLVGLVLVGVLFLFPSQQSEALTGIVSASIDRVGSVADNPTETDGSVRWRVTETRYAFQTIGESPFIGIGLTTPYRPPMEEELYEASSLNWYMHNAYLWLWTAAGLFGLVPFLWLCFAYLIRMVRRWPQIKNSPYRGVYVGFGVSFVGTMISNIVAPNLIQNWALIIYPTAMAVCEIIYNLPVEQEKTSSIVPVTLP